jgi:hypothetical protein
MLRSVRSGCLTVFAFIVKRFRVFRAPLQRWSSRRPTVRGPGGGLGPRRRGGRSSLARLIPSKASPGTPVRVGGVVVGRSQSTRPASRTPKAGRASRGPSDHRPFRSRGPRLRRPATSRPARSEEVARGLHAGASSPVVVRPPASRRSSLLWEEPGPPPAGLDAPTRSRPPAAPAARALERVARELGRIAGRDLAQVAAELEGRPRRLPAEVRSGPGGAVLAGLGRAQRGLAEGDRRRPPRRAGTRLIAAVARLPRRRGAGGAAVDAETLARLQVSLADAREAVRAFGARPWRVRAAPRSRRRRRPRPCCGIFPRGPVPGHARPGA